MTAKGLAALGLAGVVLTLSACATPEDLAPTSQAQPLSAAPRVAPQRPPTSQVAPAQASRPTTPTAAAKSPHKQYLDQRTGRYYYFDQTTHRYYWEDGTPRY